MNSEYEYADGNAETGSREFLRTASESFLANLPILVCGMVVALAIVTEIVG